jgi:GNAT superfamily N-acetyltransferase
MIITRLTDQRVILSFLTRDRYYAAYAIGDLEPDFFQHSIWYGAEEQGEMGALCLHFTRIEPNALFTMGRAAGVEAILDQALKPAQVFFASPRDHLPGIAKFYGLDTPDRMMRMVVTRATFREEASELPQRLGEQDLCALQSLYQLGGADAFAPYQLMQGVFYGIRDGDRLIAVSGTHLVARNYALAAVGNVFTHPDFRGRGYATYCTRAVVHALLAEGIDVVLNVNEQNAPAIRAYEKIGFREYCRFVEVKGKRMQEGGRSNG